MEAAINPFQVSAVPELNTLVGGMGGTFLRLQPPINSNINFTYNLKNSEENATTYILLISVLPIHPA